MIIDESARQHRSHFASIDAGISSRNQSNPPIPAPIPANTLRIRHCESFRSHEEVSIHHERSVSDDTGIGS